LHAAGVKKRNLNGFRNSMHHFDFEQLLFSNILRQISSVTTNSEEVDYKTFD